MAKNAEQAARWGHDLHSLEEHDDLSSEWNLVRDAGELWGGRKRGGRGVKCFVNTDFVSIESVSLGFPGKELLINSRLKLYPGHKYGLVGDNGVGKSTLLRCMARGSIPGFPTNLSLKYVQQEMSTVKDTTVLDYICRDFTDPKHMTVDQLTTCIARLKHQESSMEAQLDSLDVSNEDAISELADKLCALTEEIESLEKQKTEVQSRSVTIEDKKKTTIQNVKEVYAALPKEVRSVIKGLGLSQPVERLSQSMDKLSGGWRMRASLAHALVDIDNTDILLLDEPTNHLDIQTVRWLTELLQGLECIVVLVSHDRSFLDAVVSDIIEFKGQALVPFPGGYSEWQQNKEEMTARNNNMVDAQSRKEDHIKKSIAMAKARGDDSTVKSKGKKLERASMHQRLDGKRFQLFTLPKWDINSVHFPERVAAIKANKELRFKFPDPDMAGLRLVAGSASGGGSNSATNSSGASNSSGVFSSPLITLESCSITWMATKSSSGGNSKAVEKHTVLKDLSMQIFPGSRLAIVGANGSGKSTFLAALMQIVSGKIAPASMLSNTLPVSNSGKSVVTKQVHKTPGVTSLPSAKKVVKAEVNSSDSDGEGTSSPTPSSSAGGVHLWESENPGDVYVQGTYHCHHNLRVSMLSQHHFDSLTASLMLSPVQYLLLLSGVQDVRDEKNQLIDSTIFRDFTNTTSAGCSTYNPSFSILDARAHLGKFGLSGDAALQPIESLSGGQKARLCLSAVMLNHPHVLLLDEPTNHFSIDAIDALTIALREFVGAVIVVSHNQSLLVSVCNQLGVIKNEKLKIVSSIPSTSVSNTAPVVGTNNANSSKSKGKKESSGAAVSSSVPTFAELLEAYLLDALKQ